MLVYSSLWSIQGEMVSLCWMDRSVTQGVSGPETGLWGAVWLRAESRMGFSLICLLAWPYCVVNDLHRHGWPRICISLAEK